MRGHGYEGKIDNDDKSKEKENYMKQNAGHCQNEKI